MTPLCACGCGRNVNEPNPIHYNGMPSYLKGHAGRGSGWRSKSPPNVPSGLCECGCGGQTPICASTKAYRREFKGHPLPLIPGHIRPTKDDFAIRELSTVEAAYLAGIVDGEGCIHFHPTARNIQVDVANTSTELMDWLKSIGGTVGINARNRKNQVSQKVVYDWGVHSWRKCLAVLQQIAPYMIIKREKAETAIDMLSSWLTDPHQRRPRTTAHPRQPVSPEDEQRRKAASREYTRRYRERLHLRGASAEP